MGVIDGMASAGFCHYVSTPFGQSGSGMAIFSKYEIKTIDFIDWFDWTGQNSDTLVDPEATADKGVMYAKIEKDGENYHVFNTHTQSNSVREHHDTRLGQYIKIREFASELELPPTELILFGGDFNENKYKENNNQRYYRGMLEELHAVEPKVEGNLQYSLSTSENPFLASLWGAQSFEQLLDYVLVSRHGKTPRNSHCEILKPQWPQDCGTAECMLSDHFPYTCTFEGTASTAEIPGYNCDTDKNYVGETECFSCPRHNVNSAQACANLCDAQAGCTIFVHNKYGACYLKADKTAIINDDPVHQTVSCQKAHR